MLKYISFFILSLIRFSSINSQDCLLEVPKNPLSTGLFQPWYVSTAPNSETNCSQLLEGTEVFVEATILDTSTGKFYIYNPLVIDKGATPAVFPTNLTLPTKNIVAIHFGTNANSITLIPNSNVQEGLCINGVQNSVFGQFAHCNAINFFNTTNKLINSGIINVPNIKNSTLCDLCPTIRSFSIVDQDQSDNVLTTYIVTTDFKIAQDNKFNRNNLKILKIISNGSDNKVLSVSVNPAIGCRSFSAPDFENNNINRYSLALNEIEANLIDTNNDNIALIPSGNPMCLLNGKPSLEKLNAYRQGVNQPILEKLDPDDNKKYCNSMLRVTIPFLILHKNEFIKTRSPVKESSNLLNFLIDRFINSWGILNCQELTGTVLMLNVITNNEGVVIDNNLDIFINNETNISTYCTPNIYTHTYTIDMFYPTFISIFIFITYSIILIVLINTKYFYTLKKTIYFINYYISVNTLCFLLLFITWWIGMLTYSFLTKKLNELLFRLGVFIMINLAFIILPASRSNIFVQLFGTSHRDTLIVHKFLSILFIILIIIKFIIILIYYPPSFLFVIKNNMTGGSPLAGTIATFAAILITVFTIPLIKKKSYETFYFSHRILGLILIIFSVWHYIISLYFLIPSLIIYFIDLYLRFLKINKGAYLKLKKIGDDDKNNYIILKIKITKNIKIDPGCYFLVCIRNISSVEWHPFSMIEQDNKNLTFCAKNMGPNSWTDKLKILVENDINTKYNREVYIQGPYNYFDFNYIVNKYNNIISIAGGIGITPIFSIIDKIFELTYLEKIKKEIILIWIVQDSTLFKNFIEKINIYKRINVNIEIYITKEENTNLDYSIPVYYSKPDIEKTIKKHLNTFKFIPKETCILGSGPPNLLKNISSVSYNCNIDNFCENF